MRIAIPCEDERVAAHFGHAPQFALIDVDEQTKAVGEVGFVTPPPHEPGLLPRWLAEQGATVVLAGGMGGRAQDLFEQAGIAVVIGVQQPDPKQAAEAYVQGTLASGTNPCDH